MLMTLSSDRPSPETPRVGRELVILPRLGRRDLRRDLRNFGIAGACLVAAAALGWGAGAHLGAAAPGAPELAGREKADVAQLLWQSEATLRQETRQLADEVRALKASLGGLQASLDRGRPAEDVKSLKASVEALKQGLDTAKSDTAGTLAQLSGKVDRADQVAAQKLTQIVERLDRLERRPDQMPVGSIAPQPPMRPVVQLPPQPAGVLSQAKVAQAQVAEANAQSPQKPPIQGWILRDVYDGIALVEGRGGYREVSVGEAIPGVGRVEAIERHGKRWVVVTSQGVIASELN
jgi:hypothetical protein